MGRRRTFDETAAVTAAAGAFQRHGYEATSVDELVAVTGVHRASLYHVFGSKYGLFRRALHHALTVVEVEAAEDRLDLALVALLELAPSDIAVRAALAEALDTGRITPARLATRLLRRAGLPAN